MTLSLQIGHAGHTGLVREVNEDSYLILTPPGVQPPVDALLVVADGVGGANAGEIASGVLVESFLAWFGGNSYGEYVHYNSAHPDYFVAALKDLLENVNDRLYQMAAGRAEWANMGTTGTVALLSNDRLFLGHVGDTRAYVLRGGVLRQLTVDHSWVAEEVAAGRMTEAEARDHPRRNVISRVLGNTPLLRVDRMAYDMEPGDVFILTSDGLTGLVSDEEIRAAVMGTRTLQEACDYLIAMANGRGGHDNITVLAARPLPTGARATGGSPDGRIVRSVYLGQGAAPAPAGPRHRGPSHTVVARQPKPARPPRNKGGLGAALLLIVLLAMVMAALGLAAAVITRDNLSFSLGAYFADAGVAVGLLAALAVIIGFMLGWLGRQWVVERRHIIHQEDLS
ncbi:MAG: serine/threonine-protein phosphatase [Anaerolineae bacterium]|nr:serine/threonine-protein phosphatase [Anaerolineae bacterium]RIK23332.1 MAG: hypothetical protein DCC51_03895 [Anaerolineae bacterium]